MQRSVIGISARRLAESTVPASSTPRQVRSRSRAGESCALEETDRQDEGYVVIRGEPGKQRQASKGGRQAADKDRWRQNTGDRGVG
jgi:hypothetical protein